MRRKFTIMAALAVTLIGCGGDAAGPSGPSDPADPDAYRSPVGTFTLATVNGSAVPMLWDEMELWDGGPILRAYWNGGSIQFRADSTYTVVYRHSITGPNLPGNIQEDTGHGSWRLAPGAKVELHPSGGGVQYLLTTDLIYSVTATSSVPNMNGGMDELIFVFVRN
jgi:hypothetical protein